MSTTVGQTTDTSNTKSTTAAKTTTKADALGKADFLNLLMTQLKYQDPMNPMDDKSFIAEMAQFSSLEQTSKLNTTLTGNQEFEKFSAASVLIGRSVQINETTTDTKKGSDPVTTTVTGKVTEVKKTDDGIQVKVNDKFYSVDHVVQVADN
jgi:flagellar basal-body rod modification protein FlgD